MSQVTIQATAEELFTDCGQFSADADISVTFDLCPPERATRDYPGHPGVVELTGWAIDSYTIYNQDTGHPIVEGPQATTPQWVKDEVAKWVDKNEQSLIDDACEAEAEASDPYNYY
jgi:hypothetical protein